jgi:hypothetical protein
MYTSISDIVYSGNIIETSKWIHLIISYDTSNNKIKIYKNGFE